MDLATVVLEVINPEQNKDSESEPYACVRDSRSLSGWIVSSVQTPRGRGSFPIRRPVELEAGDQPHGGPKDQSGRCCTISFIHFQLSVMSCFLS